MKHVLTMGFVIQTDAEPEVVAANGRTLAAQLRDDWIGGQLGSGQIIDVIGFDRLTVEEGEQ
jgi:hypothetical protein